MVLRGTVTRLVPEHGFGFIVDDSGLDWFFVAAGIRGAEMTNLWLDERVAFSSEWTTKGPRAVDVHFDSPQAVAAGPTGQGHAE